MQKQLEKAVDASDQVGWHSAVTDDHDGRASCVIGNSQNYVLEQGCWPPAPLCRRPLFVRDEGLGRDGFTGRLQDVYRTRRGKATIPPPYWASLSYAD